MKRLLEWIKKKLGIRQPSKVMAEFYKNSGWNEFLESYVLKMTTTLNEAERTLNNEHRADT